MKVRFWGTRGSIAKAGPSTVRYGGNTSCVEVRSDSGTVVVLDCGTGAHGLGAARVREPKASRRGHVLISHTHWDHIQGLPFFGPLFVPGNEWHIYGPQGTRRSLRDTLAGQMEYTYFPITAEQFAAQVGYHELLEGEFDLGDIHVTARFLNHPALTLGYKLEVDGVTLVYATDHEPHAHRLAHGGDPAPGSEDEQHGQFLADADLVIHDTQYTSEEYADRMGWGHSTVEYVTDLSCRAAVRQLALFHHDPMRHDDALDAVVERSRGRAAARSARIDILAAAEGGELELRRSRRSNARRRVISTRSSALAVVVDRPLSVLVVGPEGPANQVLAAAVRADGHELHRCPSAAAAPGVLAAHEPAVVLVPDTEPAERIEALLAAAPRMTSLVLVTADPEAPVRDGDDGRLRWLEWPFSEQYARARIRSWGSRLELRWKPAEPHAAEAQRQSALDALGLDAEPEERFDRLARIARAALGGLSASVNLVDGDRQWSKAADPVRFPDTPRDMSFCAHVVASGDLVQVNDCARDPATADHPIVRAEPHVRFYAGAPLLLSSGHAVGTLCLVDARPRTLDEREQTILRDVARLVVEELER